MRYYRNKPFQGLRPIWTPNPAGIPAPVGAWIMNERGGNKVYDLSGNRRNGTFQGTPVWTTGGMGPGIDLGTDPDWVSCAIRGFPNFGTGPYTVIVFAATSHGGTYTTVFAFNNYAPSWYLNSGQIYIYHAGAKGAGPAIAYNDGAIHQLGWVRYGTGVGETSYFADGEEVGTTQHANDFGGAPTTIRIGWSGSGAEYWNGQVYYVLVFDSALTAKQVANIYLHPYYAWEYPEIWRYYVPAAAGGLSIPVAMHSYMQQ